MALITSMLLPLIVISVSATDNTEIVDLPPWVEDGEIWHPADGIMPLEDFGYCPQNHRPPAGYTYHWYYRDEDGLLRYVGCKVETS